MELSECSFKECRKISCGSSRGIFEVVKLSKCLDTITAHLEKNHLSRSGLSEAELILARAGHFDTTGEQVKKMLICPQHRHNLGRFWRAPRSCQYPSHTGPRKKQCNDRHVISVNTAKEIQSVCKVTVGIGSPICGKCRSKHSEMLKTSARWLQSSEQPTCDTSNEIPGVETYNVRRRLPQRTVSPGAEASEPETPLADRTAGSIWTPGCWSGLGSGSSQEDISTKPTTSEADTLCDYNEAMSKIAMHTPEQNIQPLTFQLSTTWEKSKPDEKELCIQRATEACSVICSVIAPKDSAKLFEAIQQPASGERFGPTDDLIALMSAYRNAATKNLKTQILSIYAYRYTMTALQRFHEPYGKISLRQIKRARAHARKCGPGSIVPKVVHHRVRLDTSKVDHFVDFVNRPYFYQDVAFGTRTMTLDDGSQITMPNVIRTVTRSTMIMQYMQHCKEENFEPVSRSTLYRILEVREASQQKSLSGLDNTAAEGASSFERLHGILEELNQAGADKGKIQELKNKLNHCKNYLKTEFKVNCSALESDCADHCRKFALSDPDDADFQNECQHSHSRACKQCDELKITLDEVEESIRSHSNSLYSQEQRDDLLYDFQSSKNGILLWKSHIIRSINQEAAKQEVLQNLDSESALIVTDWAMKFLQIRYRERQSDWFGKRGLSWHISSVVTRDGETQKAKTLSYAHLFDSCSQDWYAVASILENLFVNIKENFPEVKRAFLRSDEAGCYHNSELLAAAKDIGDRTGIAVMAYDFSEPQQGKDICDRVLCPMKATIRKYCAEGHDIINVSDMREALKERPVKGTTAAVCLLSEASMNLQVHKIDRISGLHNFKYEESGLRTWKAHAIGPGKLIPWQSLYIEHQGPTKISLCEGKSFFESTEVRELPTKKQNTKQTQETETDEESSMFVCQEDGCSKSFDSFAELELHMDIGVHENLTRKSETLYDKIRRDWAEKFSSVDTHGCSTAQNPPTILNDSDQGPYSPPRVGWALGKPRTGGVRFPEKVKMYLTAKFELGEKTGRKADPDQVALSMRNARNEKNERMFKREEWLTKTQITGFFSRLASRKRTRGQDAPLMDENLQEDKEENEDLEALIRESDRCSLISEIDDKLGLKHPVCFDVYDLCDYYKRGKIESFNIAMLKKMLSHFEVSFRAKHRKAELVRLLKEVIQDCQCCQDTGTTQ
ncbi:hypothetical protein ACROYT_G035406 [Oculina patagonica]